MLSDIMKELAKELGVEVIDVPLQSNIKPEDIIGIPFVEDKDHEH